ncbi:MAG: hypothetical protein LBI57_04125 [Helicobacteraceae bacterium]|jgi:hypothetical protein|nr:hypothetical protein [Helicobacteraceae bacterium]
MKKLTVLAMLAALGLFAIGCGDQAASGGSVVGGSSGSKKVGGSGDSGDKPVLVGDYTDKTIYVDPATGENFEKIGDIVGDGTGATPPVAPTFVRVNGAAPIPAPPL